MRYYIFLILIAYSFCTKAGGGWLQGKGNGFFKFGQNAIFGTYYYSPFGKRIELNPPINLYTTSIYAEYGIANKFDVSLYAPVFVRSTINALKGTSGRTIDEGDQLNAIGDFDLGIKYGIIRDKSFVLSSSLIFGLPFGETQGGEGGILQSGDGEWNQIIKIDASHSLPSLPFYVSGFTAFNNRTGGFSDEFHLGGEIGGTYKERLVMILKTHLVKSLYNGSEKGYASNSIFANNTEYWSITPELIYQTKNNWGVVASVGLAGWGKRILASPNWSMGVYLKLSQS